MNKNGEIIAFPESLWPGTVINSKLKKPTSNWNRKCYSMSQNNPGHTDESDPVYCRQTTSCLVGT